MRTKTWDAQGFSPAGLAERWRSLDARCRTWLRRARRAGGQVLYGMTAFDMVMELRKAKGRREELFTLVVFGPLLGVPIIPPYWALRLLPYVVEQIGPWRRSLMRERDFTDLIDQEIG